jgi:hypothetical protein
MDIFGIIFAYTSYCFLIISKYLLTINDIILIELNTYSFGDFYRNSNKVKCESKSPGNNIKDIKEIRIPT